MSEQSVPLLAADGMMSPVSMPSPALSVVSQTTINPSVPSTPSLLTTTVPPSPSTVVPNSIPKTIIAKNDVIPQYQPLEGFLAICGGCKRKILFPLGRTRVDCAHCNSINYLSPQATPHVPNKALLCCPKCNANILYTIGCTHFQCTCGCVIEIPIPDYYVPFVSKENK